MKLFSSTLSEQTTPYNKGDRREIKSHGLKCTGLYHTTPYNASLIGNKIPYFVDFPFDHVTLISFINQYYTGLYAKCTGLFVRTACLVKNEMANK